MLLNLMKLCLGLDPNPNLAKRFSISTNLRFQIFDSWLTVMSKLLRPAVFWSDKEAILASKPCHFSKFREIKIIIDCTEIFIETQVIQCLKTFQLPSCQIMPRCQYSCCPISQPCGKNCYQSTRICFV